MKDRIKRLRLKAGCSSQAEFAHKIGVSQSAVSRWEKGENAPSEIELRGLSQQFGVRLEWLKEGEGEVNQTYSDALDKMALILFRQLPEQGQVSVLNVLKYYCENGRFPVDE